MYYASGAGQLRTTGRTTPSEYSAARTTLWEAGYSSDEINAMSSADAIALAKKISAGEPVPTNTWLWVGVGVGGVVLAWLIYLAVKG